VRVTSGSIGLPREGQHQHSPGGPAGHCRCAPSDQIPGSFSHGVIRCASLLTFAWQSLRAHWPPYRRPPQQKARATEFEKALRNGLDDFLAQRGEEKEDRKLAKMMAERAADAAHPTNRGLNLKSFRVEPPTRRNPKTAVVLDVVYFGLQTPAAIPPKSRSSSNRARPDGP